ncbi:hypothetical protein ACIBO2_12330 [Nonomuraea sp. NPDC050022]
MLPGTGTRNSFPLYAITSRLAGTRLSRTVPLPVPYGMRLMVSGRFW